MHIHSGERCQFLHYIRTDTFVFILFPRILKYVFTWFLKCVIELSLRSLIIIRHNVIFKIIINTVSTGQSWILKTLFRWESDLFRFFRKNILKVKMVCTSIRMSWSWYYRGNFFNLGPVCRFSHTDKRLSPTSKIVFRPSFLLFSYSGIQKKDCTWKFVF